ncbi:MAG: DUF4199 domain-containing protein [Saprospiraceae bacterium]|nr:DUF4199 domain-containing protein [Saprospiraceae bacterium]
MDVLDRPSTPDPSTIPFKHLALRYGAIWGGTSILTTLVGFLTNTDPSLPTTGPIKYVYMLVGFAVAIWAVIAAIRIDRDEQLGGSISLGRCVGIGTLTGLVAGVMGAIFMMLYLNIINTGFEAQMKDAMMAQYEAQGMSEEQIEMAMSMAGAFMSPTFLAITQVFGGAFVGVIIGLIAGLFMKRESFPNR